MGKLTIWKLQKERGSGGALEANQGRGFVGLPAIFHPFM